MIVKRAKEENLPELVMLSRLWAKEMGYDVSDAEIFTDMKRMLDTGVIYTVIFNDQIVGMMSGITYRIFWTDEKVAEEHWFFVAPAFQKLGVGKLLEKAFRTWAAARKCDSVIITPNRYGSVNPKGVADYLEKQGYSCHGYRMKRSLADVLVANNPNH